MITRDSLVAVPLGNIELLSMEDSSLEVAVAVVWFKTSSYTDWMPFNTEFRTASSVAVMYTEDSDSIRGSVNGSGLFRLAVLEESVISAASAAKLSAETLSEGGAVSAASDGKDVTALKVEELAEVSKTEEVCPGSVT